ncbi:ABC-2 type transporter-domain-containing protein [Thamnocephalis sphaerospora]|uniref:ABC-2 type transporter-domain-containing protein n=1 Tax=Thamnocephalis sphaerospora TaxID=78915 RepID=A0A4P9XV32_9FUNG|nr:ABC-2 type transporter-domain-containing protein [Thamnocephalis sphaerospora]|eukprot:RKP10124.1 ABC-2 type transporter-domain-containing protein [Thamnocephalis sphaerospora]
MHSQPSTSTSTPSRQQFAAVHRASTANVYEPAASGDSELVFGETTRVNVRSAKEQYARLTRSHSARSAAPPPAALEKGALDVDGIDLAALLNRRVDEDHQRGVRKKCLGVTFRDILVTGDATGREHIQTVWSPFLHAGRAIINALRFNWCPPPEEPVRILRDITGLCASGEMLLVLGVPGSGCSTLLRVLANQRQTYKEVLGHVAYGGIPAEEMVKNFKGEVAYNQEDDVHYPMLTVKHTLDFVGRCRTPGPNIVSEPSLFIRDMVHTATAVLGLSHCLHTLVGDERIRGVSGGERKRVSIAEQIITQAPVSIWDGSTKGLDASTALDFVRSLRISTDVLQRSTIVTLYQASESIYRLFDKVLLLDKGRCLYFGPTAGAKAYFEKLGLQCPLRMTTPDFLTGVMQIKRRHIQPGYERAVPTTTREFAERFRNSAEGRAVVDELNSYEAQLQRDRPDVEFRKAMAQTRHKIVHKRSSYITPYHHQLKACLAREFHLMSGNRAEFASSLIFNAIMAIITGSVFYKLPLNSSGAFTRGGILYFSLLFNSLFSQAEVPKSFFGRGVLYKHKALALYHPSAYYIAQVLADVPRLFLQSLLFSALIYWMVGLHSTASAFLTYFLILFLAGLTMTALFRLLASISPDIEFASILSGTLLLTLLLYTGYIIPLKSMRNWLLWIRYINPLAWAFEALVLNEFADLVLTCAPPNLLPFGPDYNDLTGQTCTLEGAQPGDTLVSGEAYLRAKFNTSVEMLWPNIAITIGLWLSYVLITCFVIETLEFGKGGYTTNVYKSKSTRPAQEHTMSETDSTRTGVTRAVPIFLWNRVSYAVPFKSESGHSLQLLNNVTGWVKPGELIALMGSSGAGKTTLLDVLAQRKSAGAMFGDIWLQKRHPGPDFCLLTGYSEQMDIHNGFATVRETIRFSAYLRRSQTVSKVEKDRDVEHVIRLLELEEIADALIGSAETGKGISAEERKRVSIAVELVAKPVVLFLDEPTSGLDSQASLGIVSFLRRLADEGQAVICTIHQPSAVLFEHFDKLLLLVRGGKPAYFGEIGRDARTLLSYFKRHGAPTCPRQANPAEYILDVVGAGVSAAASQNWPAIWADSPEGQRVNTMGDSTLTDKERPRKESVRQYATGYLYQGSMVTQRMLLNYWRMPSYNVGRLLSQVVLALVLGLSFYQLGYDVGSMADRLFALFQTVVLGIIVSTDVLPQYFAQKALFVRETASGYYSWWAFTTAMLLAELPFVLLNSTVFFAINYFVTSYNPASDRALYFYLMYTLFMVFSATFGQCLAAITPNIGVAMLFIPFFSSIMALFSGVTISYADMPGFWRSWMYWLSPYHYVIEGLLTNDLQGTKSHCKSSQFTLVEPIAGQTCGAYFESFLKDSIGYIDNPGDSTGCRYCPFSAGDEFYRPFDWSYSNRWRNYGIVAGFIVVNITITCLAMSRYRVARQK